LLLNLASKGRAVNIGLRAHRARDQGREAVRVIRDNVLHTREGRAKAVLRTREVVPVNQVVVQVSQVVDRVKVVPHTRVGQARVVRLTRVVVQDSQAEVARARAVVVREKVVRRTRAGLVASRANARRFNGAKADRRVEKVAPVAIVTRRHRVFPN
jgi:hypothetical protein